MWLLYILLFLSGFVDSIAGGGALISLPAYLAAGLPAHLALGTNKFSAMPGSLTSAVRFVRRGHVQWKSAAAAFAGALVGSAIGARLVLAIPERTVQIIMLVLIPLVAVFLFTRKELGLQKKDIPTARIVPYSVAAGVAIGMYDGFFGPGTGTFLILAFTTVLGFDMLTACGNAKIVNFASNIAAFLTFILSGHVNLRLGIPCAICNVLGHYIGSGLTMKKGTKIVRPMMLGVMVLLLAKVVYDLALGA